MKLYLLKNAELTFSPLERRLERGREVLETSATGFLPLNPLKDENLNFGCFRKLREFLSSSPQSGRFKISLKWESGELDGGVLELHNGASYMEDQVIPERRYSVVIPPPSYNDDHESSQLLQSIAQAIPRQLEPDMMNQRRNRPRPYTPSSFMRFRERTATAEGLVVIESYMDETQGRNSLILTLEDYGQEGKLLELLNGEEFNQVRVVVKISNLTSTHHITGYMSSLPVSEIKTGEMTVSNNAIRGFKCQDTVSVERKLTDLWKQNLQFSGTVSITLTFPNSFVARSAMGELKDQNSLLLQEGLHTDVIIIADGGARISCHKSFLSVSSPVLGAMFRSGMQEDQTSTVDMGDVSERGVKAFLAYLYSRDLTEANKSLDLAYELLYVGHKYLVTNLEKDAIEILMEKDDDSMNVDFALKLFVFVRNIETAAKLKNKAVKAIRRNFELLETSLVCDELFRKNPMAAKELCICAFKETDLYEELDLTRN